MYRRIILSVISMLFTVVSVAEDYVSSLTIINYSIDGERFEKSVIYYQYSGNTIVGANKVTVHALADIFEVCPEDRDTFINSFTYSQKTDRIHTMRKKGENDRIERFTDYKYTYNEYGQLIEIGYQFYLKGNDGYYHPHEDEVLLNMRWSEGNMYFCDRNFKVEYSEDMNTLNINPNVFLFICNTFDNFNDRGFQYSLDIFKLKTVNLIDKITLIEGRSYKSYRVENNFNGDGTLNDIALYYKYKNEWKLMKTILINYRDL